MKLSPINSVLEEQISALKLLLEKLKDEHIALQKSNTDKIFSIAVEKGDLINQIERLNIEETLNSMSNDLAVSSNAPTIIRRLLEECHDQNLINGTIIAMSQNFAMRALALLRGQPEQVNNCYGSSGKNDVNIVLSRTIGKV